MNTENNDENEKQTEGQPQEPEMSEKEKKWKNWGATTRFGTGQGQPSREAKKAGWEKKRRSQDLARYLLGLEFVGKSEAFRSKVAQYFGMRPEDMANISNEAMIMMKQIGMAIEHGDMVAAQQIMERAYGKPKEFVDFGDTNNGQPILNIQVLNINTVPEIKTDQDDKPKELPSNSNSNDAVTE